MTGISATLPQSDSTLFARCKQYLTYRFDRTAISRIAEELIVDLNNTPRLSPSEAVSREEVMKTRQFFKKINPKFKTDLKVKECYRHYLAAKLGIKEELFEHNDQFFEFAKNNVLERYLMEYGHRLETDGNQIFIKFDEEMQPWKEVYSKFSEMPKPEGNPVQKWNYAQSGVQKENMFSWDELKPYKTVENHYWGDRYIFVMNVCCEGDSLKTAGDHNWFNLKTPKGEIYSVGKNLQSKLHGEGGFQLPFRARDAFLMSPDVSEFYPIPIHRLEVEITKEQFQIIKNSVNEDKKNENDLHIQVMGGNNCLTYIMSKAALIGIEIPTSHSIFRVITPDWLLKGYDYVMEKLPQLIKKVIQVIGTFFGNLLMIILGNASVDSSLKKRKVDVIPRINSMADMLNPDNLHFHPPTYFKKTIDELKQWQIENGKPYALPDDYLVDQKI